MIMAKNPDGTYSQVGFIKDADGNDVEFVKDKNGTAIFEKGFPREKSGALPLQLDGIGKPLKNYTIYGNTVQNGTPTPDNPVEVQAVGDYDTTTGKYEIPITTEFEDGSESITTTLYLDKPLYKIGDYADSINYAEQKAERDVKELVLTGEENWRRPSTGHFVLSSITDYLRENDKLICYTTHYLTDKNTNDVSAVADRRAFFYFNSNNTWKDFYIKDRSFSTLDDFRAYLKEQYDNGTPVTVYYVLAKPETESVTLPKIPTLDGVTAIDVDTTIKPSKMNIKYKSKT